MNENRGFISQMSDYYNLPEEVIENYYYRYYHTGEFYDKLEEYVRERKS